MSDDVLKALIAAVVTLLTPVIAAFIVILTKLNRVEVNTNSRLTMLDAKLDTALKGVAAATGQPLVSVKDAPTEVK